MKKFYSLFFAVVISLAAFAQPDPTAYYPLDADLNDAGGGNYHATDEGTTAVEFVADDVRGNVAHFAVDAHAFLPYTADLQMGTGDFSVAFWVRFPTNPVPTSDPAMFGNKDWDSGGNPGIVIALDGADALAGSHMMTVNFNSDGGTRLDWDADDNLAPNIAQDGLWHHVAVTLDRDATMKVYIDAVLYQNDEAQDSKDMTLCSGVGDDVTNQYPWAMFQCPTGTYGPDMEGWMDELRLWKGVVLTADDVTAVFNIEPGSGGGGGSPSTPVLDDATAYYPFNEDLDDYSGNDNHATDEGSVAVEYVVDEVRGQVAYFDVDAHAFLPYAPLTIGTGDYSVSLWFKIPTDPIPTGDPSILTNKDWDSGGNPGLLLALDGADALAGEHMFTVNFADVGDSRLDWDADDNGAANLADGLWHHMVVTLDRDATMKVYIDNVLYQTDEAQDSKDMTLTPGVADDETNQYPWTLYQSPTGVYGHDCAGWIDDLYMFKGKVLTVEEIATLFEAPTPVKKIELSNTLDFKVYRRGHNMQVEYNLEQPSTVAMDVYNMLGARVGVVNYGNKASGSHSVSFDASQLASGIYVFILNTSSGSAAVKALK